MLIKLFERFCILPVEPDLLPHVAGSVCTLDGLHVQVYSAILLANCCISAVCKRATAAVAETCDIELISTEVECLCLGFEAAVVVIDDLHTVTELD